jgi:hypothetical protein
MEAATQTNAFIGTNTDIMTHTPIPRHDAPWCPVLYVNTECITGCILFTKTIFSEIKASLQASEPYLGVLPEFHLMGRCHELSVERWRTLDVNEQQRWNKAAFNVNTE